MIKLCLKNYFKSLKYFLIPLISIIVGIGLGVLFLYIGALVQMSNLQVDLGELTANISSTSEGLFNSLADAVGNLPWKKPLEVYDLIVNQGWLNETIENIVLEFNTGLDSLKGDVNASIDDAIKGFQVFVVLFFVFSILGIAVGYFITSSKIRKKLAQRSIFKLILVTIADFVLSSTIVVLVTWLISLWGPSVFISSLLSLALLAFISLIEAYIAQKHHSMRMSEIVNAKSIFSLIAAYIIIVLFALAVTVLLVLILMPITKYCFLIALLVAIPLLLITMIYINLAAEAYVSNVKIKDLRS